MRKPIQLDLFDVTVAETVIARDARPRYYSHCREQGTGILSPCPWFGCRHHLGSDCENGRLRLAFGPDDFDDGRETCSIAAADRNGGTTYTNQEVGEILEWSEGEIELVIRLAYPKIRDHLETVRDDSRGGLYCNINAVKDGRK